MNKNIVKSFFAVVSGFLSVALLSIATDSILERVGIFPPQSDPTVYSTLMLAFALLYRSIYTVVGGYITARLAPSNPSRHVVILMVLGGVGGVLGAINGWSLGNHWYPALLAVTGPLFVFMGGKLYIKK